MLNNKVAFVTGAAQGIGYAISEEFAKQGANVVLADYNPKITDVAAELGEKYAGKTLGVVMNVMDNDSIQAGLDQTLAEFGQLDYVVNNAGGGVLKPFADELIAPEYRGRNFLPGFAAALHELVQFGLGFGDAFLQTAFTGVHFFLHGGVAGLNLFLNGGLAGQLFQTFLTST